MVEVSETSSVFQCFPSVCLTSISQLNLILPDDHVVMYVLFILVPFLLLALTVSVASLRKGIGGSCELRLTPG